MAMGMWLLGTLVMCTLYRSNLKAMLILPKIRLPFDNLEELVEAGITLGIPEHSLLHALMEVCSADGGDGGVLWVGMVMVECCSWWWWSDEKMLKMYTVMMVVVEVVEMK